jgi:glycogen phosphorylase
MLHRRGSYRNLLMFFAMNFLDPFPYTVNADYRKKVAYFCMEFAIQQPLKTYAGGLGFLAGSHMRSAYELKQHIIGIGILWKYGYYDQVRKQDQTMDVLFQEKVYGFLKKTDISFSIKISGHDVFVTAYYLDPEIFQTAPMFLLSTDIPQNDYLAQTICFRLYDSNPETKIAASILLGIGGARLLEELSWKPDVYHLNESHGLPLAFYLYRKCNFLPELLRRQLVYTNHTTEPGGNEKSPLSLLAKFGFFADVTLEKVKAIARVEKEIFDHTFTALQMAGFANAVSKLHLRNFDNMYDQDQRACPVISITNAQSFSYWHHSLMYKALKEKDEENLLSEKRKAKQLLFDEVADQNGEIYDTRILTIVFARRFGGYKRPELLLNDMHRFQRLVENAERPVQIIWAGKPYPMDYTSIAIFDKIVHICKTYPNCSILAGYEMKLSKLLKQGADVWLNVPRIGHEASGTSGMSAAMNGAINMSIPDGWFPEFARDKQNSFVIPAAGAETPQHLQDEKDAAALYDLLENEVIPLYYDNPLAWAALMKNSMQDIIPQFDSIRMAKEYYERLYTVS